MFDTHSHLFDEKILPVVEQTLKNIKDAQFLGVLCVCESERDINYFMKYYEKYDFLYCSIGFHPHNAKIFNEEKFLKMFEELKKTNRLVAIGEIGLDFYYNFSSKEQQIESFKYQLEFAKEHNLPVIIHSRESVDLTYEILKEKNVKNGIIHCFSESLEYAKKFIELGFMIGVSGIITFNKADNLRNIIKDIDISHIVLETDSPYLTPSPHRGKVNTPIYLKYIFEEVAKIKQFSDKERLEKILDSNSLKVFNITKNER